MIDMGKIEKNQILKIYGTDYKEMTKKLLEEAELEHLINSKNMRVGIKPNLVGPIPAKFGATTHPEIVAGIIEYLQEREINNITIMEGSWVGDKTSESFEICGYEALVEQYGVKWIDAQKEPGYCVNVCGLELNLCECVKDVDFMINVPVLKGHCQTKVTCALKNMKGLIPNTEKRRFHSLGLHDPIGHLSKAIHQDFIVVDHICGDPDFEDGGNPLVRNCIMAGLDPVLIDSYACKLLNYMPEDVGYIMAAEKLGSGSSDLSSARILVIGGQNPEEPEAPRTHKVVDLADAVSEVESCSACYGTLIPALDQLKEEGLFEKLDTTICIGQGYQGKNGKLGVGRCTKEFDYCIMGCPPDIEKIYEGLRQYILDHSEEK